MTKLCRWCQSSFEITDDDLAFYAKVSPVFGGKKYLIPPPMLCPECRVRLKFSFRNERCFYSRNCDLCQENIIALYPPTTTFPVYCANCWWSDKYDPLFYGEKYDEKRSFFEQFRDLYLRVPKLAIHYAKSQNSDYTNYSAENRNCYLSVGMLGDEDCCYCYRVFYSKNVLDSYDLYRSELCYECMESVGLYHCIWCRACQHSVDLILCENCIDCKNCFGCINLQHAEYHIFNQPYTKEEYFQKIKQLHSDFSNAKALFQQLRLQVPHKAGEVLNSVDSTGDWLINCKHCQKCFTVKNSEDCAFVYAGDNNRDSSDCIFMDNCQLQYNSMCLEKNYNVICSNLAWYVHDGYYLMSCFNSSNLFGCVGLKKNQYCILNKQYSKEEYEALVPRIIESMRRLPALQDKQMMATPPTSSSEEGSLEWPASRSFSEGWGEFFPPSLSPFGYNETVAMEYFPLTKEEALAKGFNWSDYEPPPPKVEKVITQEQMRKLPDNIKDIPDEILNWAIECEVTNKPFRIIKQELSFYREHNLPVPRRHPDQRHKDRMALRNPRKLYERQCDCMNPEHGHPDVIPSPPRRIEESAQRCPTTFQTTYSPERPEKVYCEQCYLKEVY